jgi:hypothetical protein
MVIPIVAAAAARVAATSAARATATTAARAGAQATLRTGAQQTVARTATTGVRSTAAQTGSLEGAAPKGGVGYAQNAAAERNTIQLGNRPTETRAAGERGGQTTQKGASEQVQEEQESRTRDRRARRLQKQQELEAEEQQTYKPKIGTLQLIGMLLLAVVLDGIQIAAGLLVFGVVTGIISYIVALFVNVVGWVFFGIWFALNNLSLFQGRKLIVSLAGFFADTVLAGFVPNWTLTVIAAYTEERMKAKGIDLGGLVGKATK